MSRAQQVKQVLNRTLAGLRNFRFHHPNENDSVEAQANTLRIWMWSSAAGLALMVVATIASKASVDEPKSLEKESEAAMADQMPNGFVLVPIEPTNLDSLDAVFGEHGYADLYRADGSEKKGRRLARGLALVRSPRNPRRFAVLISDNESNRISELAEPVLVILRKGPAKKEDREDLKVARRKGPIPLRKIDLIEEAEPESISLNETGESTR